MPEVDESGAPSTASSRLDLHTPVSSAIGPPDAKGKHRIMAELKRLEQEARFVEQELEELEKTEKASTACQELVHNVENCPDPLLPVTNGQANPSWERWFEGPQDSKRCASCGCWIL